MSKYKLLLLVVVIILTGITCQSLPGTATTTPASLLTNTPTAAPSPTPIPLSPIPVKPGEDNPDEPVLISGDIPYTSPFFLNSISQPFVMLEDQAGFVNRDQRFEFSLVSQVIGPVTVHEDKSLTYWLTLPAIPQGTLVDVDNDDEEDVGVQIFAVAYWSNTWGDPFLEERDGQGWSTAYASTITDSENDNEVIGGTLIVWSPDGEQAFPSGFGEDGLLFTEDDPTTPIHPGYSLVDLNDDPFHIYKEAQPRITLLEGVVAVNDYSELDYTNAFQSLFDKASREYPFTGEKGVDWDALYDEFLPLFESAGDDDEFYRALRDFAYQIPDGHIGVSFNPQVFFEEQGGGIGVVLTELSDGRVIVTQIIAGQAGDLVGMEVGSEIVEWDGLPVSEAISQVTPYFAPYSTEHAHRVGQVNFLSRFPPNRRVEIGFINPGETSIEEAILIAEVEYDSFFNTLPGYSADELALPVEGWVLDEERLGYLRVNTFSDDYNLMARLWERYLQNLIDEEIPGLVIDLRTNSGGSLGMALDFAGYFFDHTITLYRSLYYSDKTGEFEYSDYPAEVRPAPLFFEAPIAVLVSPDCVSACEGFAYALQREGRSIIIGHYPTAGAFGEVGRGQYKLPGEFTMQFPTGRPETLDGDLLIEGVGVVPDIIIPVTLESALGEIDALLEAAIEELMKLVR